MKSKKLFRVCMSMVLTIAMMASFSANCFAYAVEGQNQGSMTKAFYELPGDAVVCYMFGQPVYKSEVDDNGFVHKDFSVGISTMATNANNALPVKHQGESISAAVQIIAGVNSQTQWIHYIPADRVRDFGQELKNENPTIETVANVVKAATGTVATITAVGNFLAHSVQVSKLVGGALGGLKALTGTPYYLAAGFAVGVFAEMVGRDKAQREGIAEKMEEFADQGKAAQYMHVVTAQYGTVRGMSEWDGKTCAVKDENFATKIEYLSCEHGTSPWD